MANTKLSQNKTIIGVVGVLVIAAVVIFWFFSPKPTEVEEPKTADKENSAVTLTHLSAVALADSGDADGAMRQYDEAISTRSDNKEEKRQLLLHKANVAQQLGRYDEAISAAKQAEEMNPNDDIAPQILAATYELQGDKENAIIYYQKLIDSVEDDSPLMRYVGIWKKKIEEMQ